MPIRVKGLDDKGTCDIIENNSGSVYVTMHVERYMHTHLVTYWRHWGTLYTDLH